MTTNDLIVKIEQFRQMVTDYAAGNQSNEPWQLKSEIFDDFKLTEFNDKAERESVWNEFQLLNKNLKEKKEMINAANETFAATAESKITEMENTLSEGIFKGEKDKEHLDHYKHLVSENFAFFKQNQWPSKQRRTEAWDRFEALRNKVRELEDEFYNKLREEREKRINQSQSVSEKLLSAITYCHPQTPMENLGDEISVLFDSLIAAGLNTKPKAEVFTDGDEIEKYPLRSKSELLREIRRIINENRDELTKEDKQKLYGAIDEIQPELNKAWEEYKINLNKKQEEWEERKKTSEARKAVYEQKRMEWETKTKEFLEKLKLRYENQKSFKVKLKEIMKGQQEFIERTDTRNEHHQDYLIKLHDQVEDLEDKLAEARSDSHRERVESWIEETKERIAKVEKDILNNHKKITESKTRISEIEEKTKEVDSSIAELKAKIEKVSNELTDNGKSNENKITDGEEQAPHQ